MFENYYILITKASCSACQGAIELLRTKELNFVNTDMEYAPQILEVTKMSAGHSTVPLIWKVGVGEDIHSPTNNKFIGGFEDLQKLLNGNDEVSE